MKKATLFIVFALMSVLASAQSLSNDIVGTWQMDQSQVNNALLGEAQLEKAKLTLTFNANKNGKMLIYAEGTTTEEGMHMEMGFNLTMPFTWSIAGTTLTINPNGSASTVNFTKCKVNGEDYSSMLSMLNEGMGDAIKASIAGAIGPENFKNVTFNANKSSFTCTNKTERITLYRK